MLHLSIQVMSIFRQQEPVLIFPKGDEVKLGLIKFAQGLI
jgi:hypothetical protein